jgi:hypothetical protein
MYCVDGEKKRSSTKSVKGITRTSPFKPCALMTAPDWMSSSVGGLSASSAAAAAGRNLRALAPPPEAMVRMGFP